MSAIERARRERMRHRRRQRRKASRCKRNGHVLARPTAMWCDRCGAYLRSE